jgi:hypothetical protein
MNLGLHGEKLATIHLQYSTALILPNLTTAPS